MKYKAISSLLIILILLVSGTTGQSRVEAQSVTNWDKPVNLSGKMPQAWFPDIAVDSQGTAHIIWAGSDLYTEKDTPIFEKYDKLYYETASINGAVDEKGPFNVAVSPFGVVVRNSVAVDNVRGLVHVLFRSKGSLYYQYAPINKASSPSAWSEPRNIDDLSSSYYSDIAVDQKGIVHIIWTQVQPDSKLNLRQVVMYRQSSNLGVSWSYPKIIGTPKYAATKPVLKLDPVGGMHVSWDDGYDNYVATDFVATYGGYTHSFDNGKTWSAPVWFGKEKEPIAQTVVTPFGDTGVMLAWRVIDAQRIDYVVSNDRGETWSTPATVPDLRARVFLSQHFFDRYYLAVDGKNRVHLAVVGQTREVRKGEEELPTDLAVYHSVWENKTWSSPELVAQISGYPEYPRLAIGPDRLHVAWFVRDSEKDEGNKQLWYTSRPYDTGLAVSPLGSYAPPTPTAVSQRNLNITPTPLPILPPLESSPARSWLEEGYLVTGLAIVPVLLIGLLLGLVLFWRIRRSTSK